MQPVDFAVTITAVPLMVASGLFAVFHEDLPQWVCWTILATVGGGLIGGALVTLVALIVSEYSDTRNSQ